MSMTGHVCGHEIGILQPSRLMHGQSQPLMLAQPDYLPHTDSMHAISHYRVKRK